MEVLYHIRLYFVGFEHWNCCVEDMCSYFQLLEFQGSIARKLRYSLTLALYTVGTSNQSVPDMAIDPMIKSKIRWMILGAPA